MTTTPALIQPGPGLDLTVDGKSVFVGTGGIKHQPDQPAIVFVHGASLDHTVWVLQARYFARRGRNVCAIDLPGHGRSEGPPLETIEALGDWLAKVMDAVGLEQAAVIGHSMGSLITFDFASRYPGRVNALVLMGTSIPMPVGEALLDASKRNDYSAFDMVTIFGHGYGSQLASGETPGVWAVGAGLRLLEQGAPGVLHTDFVACNNYKPDLAAAGGAIDCAVMIILGSYDAMTPARAAKAVIDVLPKAQTVTLDCGHMMIAERPEGVLDALLQIV